MEDWTRREVVLTALRAACAFSSPALLSCAAMRSEIIVPVLISTGLGKLIEHALDVFDRSEFPAGAVLSDVPQKLKSHQKGINPNLQASFRDSVVSNRFITPISITERGRKRFMQLSLERDQWSLVSGGKDNISAFAIKNEWLSWLLEEDNCAMTLVANTYHGRCGVLGCNANVSRQEFINVSGESVQLSKPLVANSPGDLQFHATHVKAWHNCEIPADCGVEEPF